MQSSEGAKLRRQTAQNPLSGGCGDEEALGRVFGVCGTTERFFQAVFCSGLLVPDLVVRIPPKASPGETQRPAQGRSRAVRRLLTGDDEAALDRSGDHRNLLLPGFLH